MLNSRSINRNYFLIKSGPGVLHLVFCSQASTIYHHGAWSRAKRWDVTGILGTHYFNKKDKYKSFKWELSIVYRNRNICCFCLARGESEIQDTIGDCVRILSGEMRASSVKVFLYVFVRSVPARLLRHWAALSVSNHSSSDSPPFQKASDKMRGATGGMIPRVCGETDVWCANTELEQALLSPRSDLWKLQKVMTDGFFNMFQICALWEAKSGHQPCAEWLIIMLNGSFHWLYMISGVITQHN